ncbi:hypothetical protein ACQPZQ_32335 [Pseudonocardia sp. CA-142604]|uniref:hypothetical protein n=1 Tax=Pseudonocardia sp. CA-142604 TaxID=3240024 RepID=UPI003D8D2843
MQRVVIVDVDAEQPRACRSGLRAVLALDECQTFHVIHRALGKPVDQVASSGSMSVPSEPMTISTKPSARLFEAKTGMAEALPKVVDKVTPEGKLPDPGSLQDMLAKLLAGAKQLARTPTRRSTPGRGSGRCTQPSSWPADVPVLGSGRPSNEHAQPSGASPAGLSRYAS